MFDFGDLVLFWGLYLAVLGCLLCLLFVCWWYCFVFICVWLLRWVCCLWVFVCKLFVLGFDLLGFSWLCIIVLRLAFFFILILLRYVHSLLFVCTWFVMLSYLMVYLFVIWFIWYVVVVCYCVVWILVVCCWFIVCYLNVLDLYCVLLLRFVVWW